MIPATFRGVALSAVASGDRRLMADAALQLGLSVPAMVQECRRLVTDPAVYAAHPRPCRVIIERERARREARTLNPGR